MQRLANLQSTKNLQRNLRSYAFAYTSRGLGIDGPKLQRRRFSHQEERSVDENVASTKTRRQWRQRNGVNKMQRRRKCGNSRASTKMRRQQGVDEDAASKGHRHTAEWAPVRWSIHRRKTSWRRRGRGNELPAATIWMRSSSSSPVICCGRRRRCGIQLPATTDEDASTTSSRVPSIRARRSSYSSPLSVEGDNDDFLGVNPDIHGSEDFWTQLTVTDS